MCGDYLGERGVEVWVCVRVGDAGVVVEAPAEEGLGVADGVDEVLTVLGGAGEGLVYEAEGASILPGLSRRKFL